jgi:hypothetical protein
VCVKFAKQQPAPRGNLAVHCGGPGILSSCLTVLGGANWLGEESAGELGMNKFGTKCLLITSTFSHLLSVLFMLMNIIPTRFI